MNPEEIALTAKLNEAITAVISHENSSSTEVYNIEVTTSEETTEISDIHRGTVDNPFLFDAKVAECESLVFRLKHIEDIDNMLEPPGITN